MKKSRKAIAIILCLVMCLVVLAACNKTDTSEQPSSSPSLAPAPPSESMPPVVETNSPAASPAPSSAAPSAEPASPEPSEEAAVKYADHIDIILDNNRPSSINPMLPASNITPSHWVFFLLYDRLIVYDEPTNSYQNQLATNWETTDYQTYTFDLRQDVTFHNGEKFTAQDVVDTVELARAATGSMMQSQWSPVETATALSDYKLELKLDSVNIDFPMNLCMPQAGILNKKAVEADSDFGANVGTGPFILTGFTSNEEISVKRNDDFWGEKAKVETMNLRFIPEHTARTTMLLNNESQVCFGVSSEDYGFFENDNFTISPLVMNNPQGLTFNMANPITADKNFRLAVMYAIDRDELAMVGAGEWAWGVSDAVGGESLWGYATAFRNNNLTAFTQDYEKAQEYIDKSNYDGSPVRVTASVSTNINALDLLISQLAVIGVVVEPNETDTAGLNAEFFTTDSQIIFHGMTFSYAAGSCRNVFLPGGGQNRGNYDNPEVTALINEAAGTLDDNARRELYMKIQELVYDDVAFANIYWRLNGIVAVKGVGGMVLPSDTHSTNLRDIYWIID